MERFNLDVVFEAWRMLAGHQEPELGGSEGALDIVGLNLYPLCQWEYARRNRFLKRDDPRWTPVRDMLHRAWTRLGHPLLITETGANGPERAGWLHYLCAEVRAARTSGVPVLGICWYPAVSCPDWHDPTSICPAGLWDAVPVGRQLSRVPCTPALAALHEVQADDELTPRVPADQAGTHPAGGRDDLKEEREKPISSPTTVASPHHPPASRVPVTSSPHHPAPRLQRVSAAGQCRFTPENFGRSFLLAAERLSVSVYCLEPDQQVSTRPYPGVETALCVLEGEVHVTDWEEGVPLARGEVMLVPADTPFGLDNRGGERCIVLQVASPRPWSADTQGPEPENAVLPEPEPPAEAGFTDPRGMGRLAPTLAAAYQQIVRWVDCAREIAARWSRSCCSR